MKAKEILIPVGFVFAIASLGAIAYKVQQYGNEKKQELCEADPSQCQQPSDNRDDFMLVPMPGGGWAPM